MESDFCPSRFCPTWYPPSCLHFCFQGWHSHCWPYTWLTQAWKWFMEWIFTFFPPVKAALSGLIRMIPSCWGTAPGYLLAEYWPETFGITYKAQPTHGCCSPHFLLLHQRHLTGKRMAGSSWSGAVRSAPGAFPADGSSARPCHPTPSAPAPLAPAAPSAPCALRSPGPVFHPKHIKRHKLEVQLPNCSLGKTPYNHGKFLCHSSTSIG